MKHEVWAFSEICPVLHHFKGSINYKKKKELCNVNNVTALVAYFFLVQKNQPPLIVYLVCCLRLGLQSNYFVHCSKVRSLIFLQCILALNCTLLARELSHNYITFLKVYLGIQILNTG